MALLKNAFSGEKYWHVRFAHQNTHPVSFILTQYVAVYATNKKIKGMHTATHFEYTDFFSISPIRGYMNFIFSIHPINCC